MATQSEIQAKSILTKSRLSDYAVNCYAGCLHNCVYCYARYMRKWSGHTEPWGQYLDVKVNAAELIAREVTKKKPGAVFFSSACDGWQPAERKYELTRRCLKTLVEAGFRVSALTKSSLIQRDLDIFASAPDSSVGCTITTLDESLRRRLEIAASPSAERVVSLEKARELGIKTFAFAGPLLPYLTAEPANLERLFTRLAELDLDSIIVDKLNFRSGVFESVTDVLRRHFPDLVPHYLRLYRDGQEYEAYSENLEMTVREIARGLGIESKIVMAMR